MRKTTLRMFFVAVVAALLPAATWADNVVKNTTQNTTYGTLQDAFYDANAGDVIELLGDVDATTDEAFSTDFCLGIEAGITLKGNNHTLTVNRRGLSVARQSSNARMRVGAAKAPANTINVSIENLTIKNVAAQVQGKGGQLINTRGGIGTLMLKNVTFDTKSTAYNKDVRPLVIGGNQSTKATVVIDGCKFIATTAPSGNTSVAITVFNPVEMSIKSTTIDAQYAINLSGADDSYGSQGSTVTFDGSTVTTTAGAAVLFDADDLGSGANGSTVTLSGDTKITTPTAEWYTLNGTENTIASDHFATNYISTTKKYETKPTIQIGTVDELKALATQVNSVANNTAGNTYELTADLDLSGIQWTPIGNVAAAGGQTFRGTFEGNNHKISNLTINDESQSWSCAALFGAVYAGTIQNLTLENVDIQSHHYAAAFVAYNGGDWVAVKNCQVVGGKIISTPELVSGSYDNGDKVGGIVGYAVNATIEDCSVKNVEMQAYRDLGGLAGYVSAGTIENNTVEQVTLTQSNENGYKTNSDGSLADMSSTVGQVVGGRSGSDVQNQANDSEKNTAQDVTITKTVAVATIGEAGYASVDAAIAAATEGQIVEINVADTYTLPAIEKNITVKGAVEGVVFKHTTAGNIASVSNGATFENVTFDFGKQNYHGFQHAGTITMKNCVLNGLLFSYADMVFEGCTFNAPGVEASGIDSKDYSMWAYSGNLTYDNCTFNYAGKCVNVYNEDGTKPWKITVKDCTFNSTVANKAAFNVKATCGTKPLSFEVALEGENKATGTTTNAETAKASNFINEFVQVDDVNASVTTSNIDIVSVDSENNETVLFTSRAAEYNGERYLTLQEALDAAEAADDTNMVINLLNDATLDITAWSGTKNALSIGTANTESITINGNNHKLTFNQKNSDWNNIATMNDDKTKLILNDMTINNSGYNNGPWNRYDINFSCAVELNNVVAEKAVAFKNDVKLNNFTVNDQNDVYAIWIQTNGQNVVMNDVTVNAPNGRGIAVKDQYVDDATTTSLSLNNVTFDTKKKAAILVTAQYGAEIAATNLNITKCDADTENAIWVDEDLANQYDLVTVSGDVTMIPEKGVDAYTVIRTTGDKVNGYYTDLAKAVAEAEDGQTVTLKADFDLAANYLNVDKGITIKADGKSITSSAAQAVLLTGNGDVTFENVNITASAGHGIQAGDDNTAYSGKLTFTEGTLTVAKRGVRVYKEDTGFGIAVANAVIQSNVADPTTTYTTGNDAMALSLGATDGKGYEVTITDSELRGFSYDINSVTSGSNLTVTMKGGKTYGRAALNVWGSNNKFTLDGVEVHGLNNQTGPTEAFSCIVENTSAQNNVYNINGVTFQANLSEAAYTAETSTASEQMIDLRGTGSTVNITGQTTYTINEGAEERGGLFYDEGRLQNCTVNFDATAKESLAELIEKLEVVSIATEPDENGMYALTFQGVAKVYSKDLKSSKIFMALKDALTDSEVFENGSQIDLLADIELDEDITMALYAGEEFAFDLSGHTLKAGAGHILLPTGVAGSATGETDVFASVEERDDVVSGTSAIAASYYKYCYMAEHHEVAYAAGDETKYYLFEEVFAEGMPAASSTITLQKDITLVQSVSSNNSFTLNFDGHSLNRGEYTMTLGSNVTVTTDAQVSDFEDFFLAADASNMVTETEADGKYTYAVVSKESEGIYEFTDGVASTYALDNNVQAEKVTYTRSYDENRTNKYQAWFLPFDYTIKAEDLEKFTFYKANMIALQDGEMKMYMAEMSEGDVLRGNMPYIYKPLEVIDSYEFVSENVTLKAKNTNALLKMETTVATYTFFGTYATTNAEATDTYTDYYLSINGLLGYPEKGTPVGVGPYRWYLRCENKSGFDYARPFTFVADEDGQTTNSIRQIKDANDGDAYYTLDGVRVENPGRGVFIKKSADGVIRKVSFK